MEADCIVVTVNCFGTLSDLLEPRCLLPVGATVLALLLQAGDEARSLLLQPGPPLTLAPGILIFLNDVLIDHLQGTDTVLRDGDRLLILLADLSGG